MKTYRVTVDFGDDRIRTYAIKAGNETAAGLEGLAHAEAMLTVCAADDWDDYDVEDADGAWTAENSALWGTVSQTTEKGAS